ncbi:MAG: nucleotidyltransferase family protein [Xanthomonadales bacterium]|nr:nucleotidyltransferase family protein [Xanthomonadales bacterium]
MPSTERFHQHLRAALGALPVQALGPHAASHGLDAVLGYASTQGLLPASAWTGQFIRAYKSRLAVDLALPEALQRIGAALEDAGVDALLLKGEAWSRTIYPVYGVRSRCDCDIWVRRTQRDHAIGILRGLGIHEVRPYACAGEVLTPEALFRGMGLNVDLHWQLSTLSPLCRGLDFERCWKSAVPVPNLSPWRMLGPVESLLHAAVHFACPGPSGPRWIWALDGLLLLDWAALSPPDVADLAQQAGIDDLWREYLSYTRHLTGSSHRTAPAPHAPRPGRELRLLLTRADWPARLQLLHELFWPRAAYLRDRYPDSRAPLPWLQVRRWLASAKKWARRQ